MKAEAEQRAEVRRVKQQLLQEPRQVRSSELIYGRKGAPGNCCGCGVGDGPNGKKRNSRSMGRGGHSSTLHVRGDRTRSAMEGPLFLDVFQDGEAFRDRALVNIKMPRQRAQQAITPACIGVVTGPALCDDRLRKDQAPGGEIGDEAGSASPAH